MSYLSYAVLFAFVADRGEEVEALSKCVWALRYHEPYGVDVTIQLEEIQYISLQTLMKKGEGIFILPSTVSYGVCCKKGEEVMSLSKYVYRISLTWFGRLLFNFLIEHVT